MTGARPYRWDLLPRVRREEIAMLGGAAALVDGLWSGLPDREGLDTLVRSVLGGAEPRVDFGAVYVLEPAQLAARLASQVWAAARVRSLHGGGVAVIVEGALLGRVTARVFGSDAKEAFAPRAATLAEKGVLAFLAAAALEAWGARGFYVDGTVDDAAAVLGLVGGRRVVGIDAIVYLDGIRGSVSVVAESGLVTDTAGRGAMPLGARARARLDALPLCVAVEGGWGSLTAQDLGQLGPGDVVILDRAGVDPRGEGRVTLRIGSGGVAARTKGPDLVIEGKIEEEEMMTKPSVEEGLLSELPVPLCCQLGEISLSARELLELAPGVVLPLGRPLGSDVELRAHGRVIARGELVDVEGELGVRVVSIGSVR